MNNNKLKYLNDIENKFSQEILIQGAAKIFPT